MGKMRAFSTTLAPERRQSWQVIESRCAGSGLARSCCPPGVVGSGCRSVTRCRSSSSSISLRGRLSRSTPSPCRSSNKPRQQRLHAQRDRRTQPTSRRCHSVVGGYTRHVGGCAPGRALRLPRQADTARGCSPIQTIVWANRSSASQQRTSARSSAAGPGVGGRL